MNSQATWQTVQEWALKQGLNYNTVKSWRIRRVPHKYRIALIEYAKRTGKPLNRAALDWPAREGNSK